MQPTWFRRPTADRPGTLNACYDALDRHVVAGRADRVAVVSARGEVTVATLLEQVGALAGGLRALGVTPGHLVAARLADPYDALLVTLAALRLGAVTGDIDAPDLLVTDTDADTDADTDRAAPLRVLRGPDPADPGRDYAWDVVVRAGRQDPAPCSDVEADAPAYVVRGRVVSAEQAASDDSATGRLLGALGRLGLAEGRAVEL